MQIAKTCHTLNQAKLWQDRLYAKYDSVVLVRSPRFTPKGVYIWEVTNRKVNNKGTENV